MINETAAARLKDLKSASAAFVRDRQHSAEDIHRLRTAAREILSLLSAGQQTAPGLKKLIKVSNSIRDIDVLNSGYLPHLPEAVQKKIRASLLRETLQRRRKKELKKLTAYLQPFSVSDIRLTKSKKQAPAAAPAVPDFNIKRLHQYRIYIKQQLYIARNTEPDNQQKIRRLSRIKDLLGDIHDNHNALKMIRRLLPGRKYFTLLQAYNRKENKKKYHKAGKLIAQLANH